jgi:hypothetical protein
MGTGHQPEEAFNHYVGVDELLTGRGIYAQVHVPAGGVVQPLTGLVTHQIIPILFFF